MLFLLENREANKLKSISPQMLPKASPLENPYCEEKMEDLKGQEAGRKAGGGYNKEIVDLEGKIHILSCFL